MNVNTQARLIYIEPNEIPLLSGVTFGSSDNITWNHEDLDINVDLQVVVPQRENCGTVDYDSKLISTNIITEGALFDGFFSGVSLKDNESFLTTNYTDISYMEIKDGNKNVKEYLGVKSIDISFDKNFFPNVAINFVDVRGYSLMMPAEEDYKNKLSERNKSFENFYKSLFSYPYPRFLLTIKGFYGTKVTFILALNDFKTQFNSDTGDFEVLTTFKGYMYGVYSDIPFNLLMIAPYIKGYGEVGIENKLTSSYWEQQKNARIFVYDNGTPMFTFLEYMQMYTKVSEEMSKEENITDGNPALTQYIALQNSKPILENLKQLSNSYYESLVKQTLDGDVERTSRLCLVDGDDNKNGFTSYLFTSTNFYSANDELIKSYNEQVEAFNKLKTGVNHLLRKLYPAGSSDTDPGQNNNPNYNGKTVEIDKTQEYIRTNVQEFKYKVWHYAAEEYHYITDYLNAIDNTINNIQKKANEELNARMAQFLGFSPNIQNYYRMLFAHLDSFMTQYYAVLKAVKDKDGNGRNLKDFAKYGIDKSMIDVSQSCGEEAFVPAYPAIYKKSNDGRNEMVYPSVVGLNTDIMPELDFIERINIATEGLIKEVNLLRQLQDSTNGVTNDGKMYFIASLFTDIYHNGVNPYDCLKTQFEKEDNPSKYVGGLLYTFILRYFASKLTCYKEFTEYFNAPQSGIVTINNFSNILANEALNFSQSVNGIAKNNVYGILNELVQLSDINFENKIKEILEPYTNNNPQIIYKIKFDNNDIVPSKSSSMTSNGSYIDTNLPIFFNTPFVSYKDNSVYNWLIPVDSEEYNRLYASNNIKLADCNSVINLIDNTTVEMFSNNIKIKNNNGEIIDNAQILKTSLLQSYYHSNCYCHFYESNISNKDIIMEEAKKDDDYSTITLSSNIRFPYFWVFDNIGKGNFNIYPHLFIGNNAEKEYLINYTKGLGNNAKYAKAMILLGSLPFNTKTIKNIIYELERGNKSVLVKVNKGALLFIGALLYRYQIALDEGIDICGLFSGIKHKAINKYVETSFRNKNSNVVNWINEINEDNLEEINIKEIIERVDYVKRLFLVNLFKKWVIDGEFESLYSKIIDKNQYVKNDKIKLYNDIHYVIYENSELHSLLSNFIIESYYLLLTRNELNPVSTDRSPSNIFKNLKLSQGDIKTFITNIKNNLSNNPNEIETVNDSDTTDLSNEMKLNIYYTLKQLYDKWLCSYTVDTFKLKTFEEDYQDKVNRFEKGEMRTDKVSEYCNFLFVDQYYNDISSDLLLSPQLINETLMQYADGTLNGSVLEIMYDWSSKNGALFMCLPVYNNYYDSKTITNVFTPNPQYNSNMSYGNTYICMYTHEPSHIINTDGSYQDDGLDLAGTIDNNNKADIAKYFSISKDINKLNIKVPAFGVTYAKQNQMYFKDISVNMDNPKITDYSINNLFSIAKGSSNGDVNTPFALGQNIYSIYSNRSYNCDVEMMGCANIMPMMYFQLNNIPMFKGVYMITSVSHNIIASNMTTKFSGTRVSRYQFPYNKNVFNLQMLAKMLGTTNNKFSDTGGAQGWSGTDDNVMKWNGLVPSNRTIDMKILVGDTGEFKPLEDNSRYGTVDERNGSMLYTNRSHGICIQAPTYWYKIALEKAGHNGNIVFWKPKDANTATIAQLNKFGFSLMKTFKDVESAKLWSKNNVQIGDICTMHYYKSKNNTNPSSHGCMWAPLTGNIHYSQEQNRNKIGWISDFFQGNNFWPNNTFTPRGETPISFWRLN